MCIFKITFRSFYFCHFRHQDGVEIQSALKSRGCNLILVCFILASLVSNFVELAIIIESSAILKVASTKVISDPQGYTSILVYLPGSPRLCQGPESKVGLELLGQLKMNGSTIVYFDTQLPVKTQNTYLSLVKFVKIYAFFVRTKRTQNLWSGDQN